MMVMVEVGTHLELGCASVEIQEQFKKATDEGKKFVIYKPRSVEHKIIVMDRNDTLVSRKNPFSQSRKEQAPASSSVSPNSIPPSQIIATTPPNKLVVMFADPDTRQVEIDVPIPKDGVLKPVEMSHSGGTYSGLRFDKASIEQKAHYVFWSNGTQNRVDKLIGDGGRGAGLRQTLKWLISMRIEETAAKTGWRYRLLAISDKKQWEEIKAAR